MASWPPKLLQSPQTKARPDHLPWKPGPAKPRADMLARARCSRQAQWHKVSELPGVYEIRHNRKSDHCFYMPAPHGMGGGVEVVAKSSRADVGRRYRPEADGHGPPNRS